jgi:hypothetical protein
MLMREATSQTAEKWKAVWNEYKDRLRPNRKSGAEVAEYLAGKYPLIELHDDESKKAVTDNVLGNKPSADKLPPGASPSPAAFIVENRGAGEALYEDQDEVFKGISIFVGIDLESGCFFVEGSGLLWDELYAFQGLDEDDIQNYYCVAEYVTCLKRFGVLDKALR